MDLQILLEKNKSKTSVNINNSLAVQLNGSKRILPCDPMETTISEIDVYNNERENCNKIRLTVQINPICTNVLFNNLTEIVKNEGTDNTIWVNYGENYSEDLNKLIRDNSIFFKSEADFNKGVSDTLNAVNAIRDTQLSSEENGYKYHCGLDIFNNHLLRSKTFKTVCPLTGNTDEWFNTIFDYMRTYEGEQVKGYSDIDTASERPDIDLHLYLSEEIMSFKETVTEKLTEKNGWFGFTNVGKLKVYDDINDRNYDWFKVINYRKPCDFIDMYPNRELFFFDPLYNSYRQRVEKNWLYCITYPSSSTTDISFIKKYQNGSTGLKVMLFDDTIKHKNGVDAIKIYSVSKHGLAKDNNINLYKSVINEDGEIEDICVLKNIKVIDVVDDYTFYVFRNGVKLSNKWLEIPEGSVESVDGFNISKNKKYVTKDGKKYFIVDYKKVNVDMEAQDISFKRVVDYNETSYYVRIFSKLPNWKFARQKPTELLLEKFPDFIREYQTTNYDFESHIGKLAFSKNIYTDNISEIVFTDDIDIGVLKDNLGRPLSEIYLTIIKNNAGYREWYGKYNRYKEEKEVEKDKDEKYIDINNPIVEYSHCFGKLNCAFKLHDIANEHDEHKNVMMINNFDGLYNRQGLDTTIINNGERSYIDDDEIQYEKYGDYLGDYNFYGDLCCYSENLCEEQSIQMVDFRFNTMQRELNDLYNANMFFNDITYDEIGGDDYDYSGFIMKDNNKFTNAVNRKEGYYYTPHYKINIKSYDKELTTHYPRILKVKILNANSDGTYNIVTMNNHLLGENSIINIYDKKHDLYYYGKVIKIINSRSLDFKIYDDKHINVNNKNEMKFFIKGENTPSYAHLLNDGSCRYVFRELKQNGFDDDSENEVYPFTNNSLYINKNITFFLRRQNPNGTSELRSKTYPYDIVNNTISFEKENKYYHEEEIQC